MNLICDERERNGPLLHLPDSVIVRTITTGDYAIVHGEDLLHVIERKTWSDLAASIKDGRFKSQLESLAQLGCPYYVLIEGNMTFARDHLIGGIPFHKLDAVLHELYFKNIPVIRTKNSQHTADFLIDFLHRAETFVVAGGKCAKVETLSAQKKIDPAEVKRQIFRALPSVGPTLLPSFANISLREIFLMSERELAEIKYTGSGRKIGKASANILRALIPGYNEETRLQSTDAVEYLISLPPTENKAGVKILSAFPGISKKSAEFILANYPLAKIILSPENIVAQLQKSHAQKIGPALAKKINALVNLH